MLRSDYELMGLQTTGSTYVHEYASSTLRPEFATSLDERTTKRLFDEAFRAGRAAKQEAIWRLKQYAESDRLLAIAVDRFQVAGNADRLNLASYILSSMGDRALSTYLDMARRLHVEDRELLYAIPLSELSPEAVLKVISELRERHPSDGLTRELWEATFGYGVPYSDFEMRGLESAATKEGELEWARILPTHTKKIGACIEGEVNSSLGLALLNEMEQTGHRYTNPVD